MKEEKQTDHKANRLHTFQTLLKDYEEKLRSGTLYPYQVKIYQDNVEYFKEELKKL